MRTSTIHAVTAEADLLATARSGDADAFEQLVRLHDDRFRAVAFRMLGTRAAMDDALQDAYMRAFRSIDRFRGDARFTTWMHRIVTTTCIDHLRRRSRRAEEPLDDEDDSPPRLAIVGARTGDPAGDPAGDAVTRRLDLRRALDTLPADHRAALLLVDGEGLSYDEVGEILGVPAGTVSSRLSRARRVMRTLLEPDHHPGREDDR